jgi:Carboxypeptidase regulatory-like domain
MRGIGKLKFVCASALVGLTALVAASPAAALNGEGDPLLPNTGNIRGTVTEENGNPIDNLEVCAMTESSVPFTFTYCSRTEEGGQYLIYNVPEGNFQVWANAAWYLAEFSEENFPQVFYPGVKHSDEATWVPVHGDATTTGIDFQVHEGGEIEGTVTDQSSGGPVAGVEVCPTWVGGPARAEGHSCGFTDAAGHYVIRNVDTDEYTLQFKTSERSSPEYEGAFYPDVPTLAEAEPVSVTAGEVTKGIDEHLQHVGSESTATGTEGVDSSGTATTSADGSSAGTSSVSDTSAATGIRTVSRPAPLSLLEGKGLHAASPRCPKGSGKVAKGANRRCVKTGSKAVARRSDRRRAHRKQASHR